MGTKIRPFVKWAGGKRQIIDKLLKYIPEEYNCYYEPFVGGGALLFELTPKKAVINDSNEELMNVYRVLKDEDEYTKMCHLLDSYETKHDEEFFYRIRNKDRDKEKLLRMSNHARAARTLYLNKACFNGLYRVNSKGQFNVPYGKKEKVNTYEGENLLKVCMYLSMNDVSIRCTDFEEALKDAKEGDFVYLDPPYDTMSNAFTTYTDIKFGKEEQMRVCEVFKDLDRRGVKVMLSNHNTPLIQELYHEFYIHTIEAKRNINSNGAKRGNVEDVIITNYQATYEIEE